MSDYSTTIAAIVQQAKTLEQTLPIRNDACRSKFYLHSQPTPKVCLFFHGFTAGPYQFAPLGKTLFAAGYNVLVPLQPGHGVAGNFNGDNPPPLPMELEVYQEFALSWMKIAQNLGTELIIGGLSTGGTLSAWLAQERYQEIAKAILFSPFLGGTNLVVDFLLEVLPIYFEWLNKDNPGNFGYQGFRMPALRLFLDLGQELVRQAENRRYAPIFVISSDSDRSIDHTELKSLFHSTLPDQPKSWYYSFDRAFEIPHTMMTELEGNKYQELLNTIVKAYIQSNLTWDQLLQIGCEILQGQTFDAAVDKLNFTQLVPEVSVLLTVMQNQKIIDACK